MGELTKGLIWLTALAVLGIGILRGVALRWWRVPSDDSELAASISPTLAPGDWVILWRLTPPGFSDLVLCPDPEDPSLPLIGRLVGEAGDDIELRGADVYINTSRIPTENACPDFFVIEPGTGTEVEQSCTVEIMGGERHRRGNSSRKDGFTAAVGPGQVFLLSDNRHFSLDSRERGTIERKSCKETIVFRLFGEQGFGDHKTRLTLIR